MAAVGFDFLSTVGDQHRVFGLHHDEIFHADGGHKAGLGIDVAVFGVMRNHVAVMHVAFRRMVGDLPERRPGADIAPACVHRHHHRVGGFFHHRVVDGLFRAGQEGFFIDADKIEIRVNGAHGFFAGVQDIRAVFGELFQVATGAEQEHAAVPVIFAAVNVGLRGFQIRFFDELRDAEGDGVDRHVRIRDFATADVAVAGFRQVRHDAEGDQLAALGERHRGAYGIAKRVFVLNDMVSRQYQHQRIGLRAVAFCRQRRQRDSRRGVTSGWLQNDVFGQLVKLAQLLGDDKAMLFVTDNHRAFALHAV
ncbi:hypothetical protein BN132_3938 [Cronobacter turicensis 564]|nr:hypothetical protein BN132_3938 [Cronobacter turicensis 564]